jgi:hypothetical protein
MSADDRFRVNAPSVAWEDFDDEVIMVNLESGQYYSTRAVGAEIWRRLEKGACVSAVEQAIAALYDVDGVVAAEAVSAFVGQLSEHGLMLPNDEAATQAPSDAVTGPKRPFQTPVLEMYSDMQDLLLLDPIHDVDESGWPNPR